MASLRAWFARVQWWLWAAVSLAVAGVVTVLSLGRRKDPQPAGLPPVPDALRKKVEKAEEAALVAKAEATVKSEEKREQLQKIGKIDDGKERRKQLANFIKDL